MTDRASDIVADCPDSDDPAAQGGQVKVSDLTYSQHADAIAQAIQDAGRATMQVVPLAVSIILRDGAPDEAAPILTTLAAHLDAAAKSLAQAMQAAMAFTEFGATSRLHVANASGHVQ